MAHDVSVNVSLLSVVHVFSIWAAFWAELKKVGHNIILRV